MKRKSFIPIGITFIGAGIVFIAAVNLGVGMSLLGIGVVYIVLGCQREERSELQIIQFPISPIFTRSVNYFLFL